MVDVSDPAIAEAYNNIRNDANPLAWVVLSYNDSGKALQIEASGDGGLSDMTAVFQDDKAHYGYIRVTTGDEESKRTKFLFISWCGESVGALKRAKMSVHKAEVKKVFRDFALEIHGTTKADFEENEVMTKVKKAGGADYSGNLYQ